MAAQRQMTSPIHALKYRLFYLVLTKRCNLHAGSENHNSRAEQNYPQLTQQHEQEWKREARSAEVVREYAIPKSKAPDARVPSSTDREWIGMHGQEGCTKQRKCYRNFTNHKRTILC